MHQLGGYFEVGDLLTVTKTSFNKTLKIHLLEPHLRKNSVNIDTGEGLTLEKYAIKQHEVLSRFWWPRVKISYFVTIGIHYIYYGQPKVKTLIFLSTFSEKKRKV